MPCMYTGPGLTVRSINMGCFRVISSEMKGSYLKISWGGWLTPPPSFTDLSKHFENIMQFIAKIKGYSTVFAERKYFEYPILKKRQQDFMKLTELWNNGNKIS